jgi:PITH domain
MAACSRYFDLCGVVDTAKSSVVGARPGESMADVLENDMRFVQSDADEELLFHFYFSSPVKLHSIKFRSYDSTDEVSGPASVRVFANNADIDFSDAADSAATQELSFDGKQLEKDGDESKLQFVKFQLIKSLTLFVNENQDDTDSTRVDQIVLIGLPTAGTDMTKLQKVG